MTRERSEVDKQYELFLAKRRRVRKFGDYDFLFADWYDPDSTFPVDEWEQAVARNQARYDRENA